MLVDHSLMNINPYLEIHFFLNSSRYAEVMIPDGNAIKAIPTTADIIPMILPVIVTGYTSP